MFKIYNDDAYSVLDKMIKDGIYVDHVITDPPYNISKKNNFATMSSADRIGVDFGEWDKGFDLISWIPKAAQLLNPGGSFIVFNSYRNLTPIITEMEKNGLVVKDVIKWIKDNPMPRNIKRRYVQDTEFAIWAVSSKGKWVFNVPEDLKYLRAEFHTSTVSGHERVGHPTQKSLKLMSKIISIHSNPGDLIFDPFMGSGSTGVSALQLSRNFIGVELEKEYFDIANKRLKGVNNECRTSNK
ncbi:site-specific DNA-methyltransferase [Candidatus Saccharibacteria bacterium]|nr:site-specific DNA-methyltransferase [Candidatus Saccharibacteria bacterium]